MEMSLQAMAGCLKSEYRNVGLIININKTDVMFLSKGALAEKKMNTYIGGEELQKETFIFDLNNINRSKAQTVH